MSSLTLKQEQVLTLFATGCTVTAAAEAAGVHRNTIGNWRRTVPEFDAALSAAQHERILYWCDYLQSLGDHALQNLQAILTNGNEKPAILLRASLAIFDRITKPLPVRREVNAVPPAAQIAQSAQFSTENVDFLDVENGGVLTGARRADQLADLLNQQAAGLAELRQAFPPAQDPQTPAEPHHRTTPSHPGRNTQCPCGSGLKFKRCCLGEPNPEVKSRANTPAAEKSAAATT